MYEPNLKMCSANSSGKGKNIKQMLCAGGHCSHDRPSTKMRSKMDKAEMGEHKVYGEHRKESDNVREETNQTKPFQSIGCSKRNCRSYLE